MWLRSRYTFVKAFAVNFKQQSNEEAAAAPEQSNEEAAAAPDRPSKNAGFPFDVFLKAGEGLQSKFGHLRLAMGLNTCSTKVIAFLGHRT